MQIIACGPDTPRFPPPYREVDVFEVQERIIESILGDVEQQEAAAVVNKPVAEEQALVSQVIQAHLNSPEYDRKELRELRKFLKQPLVGASVQQLRKALQSYSSSNEVDALIDTVRELYQHQAEIGIAASDDQRRTPQIRREDLKLICYEYIYA